MRSKLVPILLNSVPGWVRNAYPGVWPSLTLAAHYDADQYWIAGIGQVAIDQLQTCTRAATKYVANSAGILVPKAANINPREDLGLLPEQAATCLALWNRDLTNANWTASSVTPLKDQVGMDGVANSASSLLATGNNGTLTAAGITSASASRTVTVGVKRVTGSGVVSISQDGGSTFTAITTKVGASWYIPTPIDFAGLTQTVTNPQIVIKLGTSGDKIAVDFVDLEAGAFNTSPIATTTVAVTRAADSILLAGSALTAALASKAAYTQTKGLNPNATNSNDVIVYWAGAGQALRFGGNTVVASDNSSVIASATIGGAGTWTGRVKAAYGYDTTSFTAIANGGTGASQASSFGALTGNVALGNRNTDFGRCMNGYLERIAFGSTKGMFDGLTA